MKEEGLDVRAQRTRGRLEDLVGHRIAKIHVGPPFLRVAVVEIAMNFNRVVVAPVAVHQHAPPPRHRLNQPQPI
jgi:hypothetical protein